MSIRGRTGAALLALILVSGLFPALASAGEPESHAPKVVGGDVAAKRHPFEGGVFTSGGLEFAPDRILVKFRPGTATPDRAAARASVKGSVQKTFGLVPGLEALSIPSETDPIAAAVQLSR